MNDAIAVLNAGSSSLKFSIYSLGGASNLTVVASGQVEGLLTQPHFKVKDGAGTTLAEGPLSENAGTDASPHDRALAHIAGWMRAHFAGQLTLVGVGHRVVHGGHEHVAPTLITLAVLASIEKLTPLMPLHLLHNLAGVRAVIRLLPGLPQVACFDTAFHQGRAKVTQRFGIADKFFAEGIRRWGYHGLSYESIAMRLRDVAPSIARGRVIVGHLGSGVSLCAMRDGRSVDTTMGFSALDGMPMGTRCGTIDPGAVLALVDRLGRKETELLLYAKSGLLGLSGVSNDMRDLLASSEPLAREAVDYFVFRAVREIGALTAVLGGVEAIVFTAGIGEHAAEIRTRIAAGLEWLGARIDTAANERSASCISLAGSTPSLWVIPTDEEGVIARHTLALLHPAATGH